MKKYLVNILMPIVAIFLMLTMFQNCGDTLSDSSGDGGPVAPIAEDEITQSSNGPTPTPIPAKRWKAGALFGPAGVCGVVLPVNDSIPRCNTLCSTLGATTVCSTEANILCVSPQPAGSAGEYRVATCE